MARDFHPERYNPRGLQKNQRALEILLDQLFDFGGAIILSHADLADLLIGDPHTQYVLLAGRAGGQTILQGVTIDNGLVVTRTGAPSVVLVDRTDGGAGSLAAGATNLTLRFPVLAALELQSQPIADIRAQNGLNLTAILRVLGGSPANSLRVESGGIAFFNTGSFGGGVGVKFQANATTAPTSNPVGGGVDYKVAGADTYRGSGGSITTRAPA